MLGDDADSKRKDTIAYIAIIAGAVMLILGIAIFESQAELASSVKIPGIFVADTTADCLPPCSPRKGTFVSDDGKIKRSGVRLRDRPASLLRAGDTVRAIDVGSRSEVFPANWQAGSPVVLPAMLSVLGVVGLGTGFRHVWVMRRRRA